MSQCQRCGAELPPPETGMIVGIVGEVEFAFTCDECPVELIATVCPACTAPVYCESNLNRECSAGFGGVPLDPEDAVSSVCAVRDSGFQPPHPRQSLRERRRLLPR